MTEKSGINIRLLRCAILTQGKLVPSSRFRLHQNLPFLRADGISPELFEASLGAYPPSGFFRRLLWGGAAAGEGFLRVMRARASDLVLLQRGLISAYQTFEPLISSPLVLDVDDAIFLSARRKSADKIARRAELVICGNSFLADYFSVFSRIEILPTAIDVARFVPRSTSRLGRPVIGWSGSSSGFAYLYGIQEAIAHLFNKYPELLLKVIADRPPIFNKLPPERILFEPWSQEREVEALYDFTIGLMPLGNTPWERGKCSFKMLTYMAVGLPVVVSPVGMNAEVLSLGSLGFGAITTSDWVDSISYLIDNPEICVKSGSVGRAVAEAHFSTEMIGPKLSKMLRSVAEC